LFALAIAALPVLATYHLAGWLPQLRARDALLALAGLWLGAWTADLVTGIVHWACDTWGGAHTPVVGATLIRAFREHHEAPRAMLDHDWIDVNAEPVAAASAAFAVLALPGAQEWLVGRPFCAAFAWSLIVAGALANQIHQWSHSPAPPRLVAALQRVGIVLSPARHARHHRPPHTTDYCITGGWLNRALDAAGFWRALERAITRWTGAAPRAGSESLSSRPHLARGASR
jgi:ubiquitin-conjugating enzyme E2 variant